MRALEGAEMTEANDGEIKRREDATRPRLDRRRIKELYAQGKTPTEVSRELGYSRSAVSRYRPSRSQSQAESAPPEGADHVNGAAIHGGNGSAPQASVSGANGHVETPLAELVEFDSIIDRYWHRVPRAERLNFVLQRSFSR
jgi:Homeodomain-like domain